MKNILISKPLIDYKDISCVSSSIVNGWGPSYLKYNMLFEKNFKKYIGRKYSIATSSCTGATHIALKALDIKKNDEVIIPNLTWFSCASVVTYLGATPVFIDVDSNTFCIDPKEIEKKITKKTKVILIVHLYGAVCNLNEIQKIAKKYNIKIIEDCAESLGSKYKNKLTGSFGDISVFSFHGSKTISTGGEGGAILTNDKILYKKMLKISNHGKNNKKIFYQDLIGLKYKMSTLQCAMGISQLSKLKKINYKKEKIYNFYKKKLGQLAVKFQVSDPKSNPRFWMPTFICIHKKFKRDNFINFMKKKNINTRPVFFPLNKFPCYKKYVKKSNELKISHFISKNGVNLPSYYDLTIQDLNFVVKMIIVYFKKNNLIKQ